MTKNNSSLRNQKTAVGLIFFADILWGLGFVMAQWTLALWSPGVSSFLRLSLAFALCAIFFGLRGEFYKREMVKAFIPGLLNGGVLIFQTWGIKYTDVTKVGFITTLYVVLVPLFERVFFKRKLHRAHWALVLLSMCGTLLISGADFHELNVGDLLTLVCSVFAALHIISLSNIDAKISPIRFNMWQSFWSALLALASVLIFERGQSFLPAFDFADPQIRKAFLGMSLAVLGPSIIAFSLQVHAQRFVSPAVAGLLYLLECIFGALFAFLLLGERMSPLQWGGAALILAGAFGVVRLETRIMGAKT
jgi:drug/metabolite transporter (DMT)-like permease